MDDNVGGVSGICGRESKWIVCVGKKVKISHNRPVQAQRDLGS